MQKNDYQKRILQNLKEAGCNSKVSNSFLENWENGKTKEAFELLEKQRKYMLDNFNKLKVCIDRLDYFVYILKKEYKM